jgi:hypothetical protein
MGLHHLQSILSTPVESYRQGIFILSVFRKRKESLARTD